MQSFKNKIVAAFGAVLATGISVAAVSPAQAAGFQPDTVQARVRYADLNLASSAGKATMDGRIRAAARTVCGRVGGTQDLRIERCYNAAIAQANRDLPTATVLASR